MATTSLSLYRRPLDGTPGQDAIVMQLSMPVVAFPTSEGKVTGGTVSRDIRVSVFRGSQSLEITALTTNASALLPYTVAVPDNTTVRITATQGATWGSDSIIEITASFLDVDGSTIQRTVALNVVGSAQGQTVTGPQGASISKVEEYYLATVTATAPDASASGWSPNHIEPTATLPYVWNKEVVYIKDPVTQIETPVSTDVHLCCTFSDGLISHDSLYKATDTRTTPEPTSGGWLPLAQAMATFDPANRFFWNRETSIYKDSRKNRTEIRLVAVWGEQGPQGDRGDNGQAVLTSYVFTRSSATSVPRPTGGSFENPVPLLRIWSANIPEGNKPLWMSSRIFTSDGLEPQQSSWSTPTLLVDSPDIDFEYSAVETEPGTPSSAPANWHNNATELDIWIAMRKKVGGAWSAWEVARFQGKRGPKGEPGPQGDKGDKGDPGTGIDILASALKYYENYVDYYADEEKKSGLYLVYGRLVTEIGRPPHSEGGAYLYYYDVESDTTEIEESIVDGCYFCEENGHLFLSKYIEQEEVFRLTEWHDAGNIRGKDAVLYTLDIPAAIAEGTTDFDIRVMKTTGSDTHQLTFSECQNENILVMGSHVQWNATNQRFHMSSGTEKDAVYSIRLFHNGYLQKEYRIPCVGSGNPGYDGCIVRRSEWQIGVKYHNDRELSPEQCLALYGDATRYIDEVTVTDLVTGEENSYVATAAHNNVVSALENKPSPAGSTTWWTKMNNLQPLRTSFADIMTAFIQFLQVNQIVIEDPTTHLPYGAFGAPTENNPWPLWFGGHNPLNAITRFSKEGDAWLGPNFSVVDGNVTSQDMTARNMNAEGGSFKEINVNKTFSPWAQTHITLNNDNIYQDDDGATFLLENTPKNSGRIIRVTTDDLANVATLRTATIQIAEREANQFFYEDGIMKTQLTISNQMVELLGRGTSEVFTGWVVLRRIDLTTNSRYGHTMGVLGYGQFTHDHLGVDDSRQMSFDNQRIFISPYHGILTIDNVPRDYTYIDGVYRMFLPANWFYTGARPFIQLTGMGAIGNAPVKATILRDAQLENGQFVAYIATSDGEHINRGSFNYTIQNFNAFMTL